jgi:hypothetical protein
MIPKQVHQMISPTKSSRALRAREILITELDGTIWHVKICAITLDASVNFLVKNASFIFMPQASIK